MIDGGDLGELRALAARLARARQADILTYGGELSPSRDGQLMPGRQDRPTQPVCLLLLSTLGGSSDAAYRLVRTLRRRYRHLTVYVDDLCKSGGMLLALAADELVMSDFGELGPLISQDDPIHIDEAEPAQRTVRLYAERLALPHLKDGALDRLLTGYPSHDFVIDREEATDLLRTVRAPTSDEAEFLTHAEPILHDRRTQSRLLFLDDALAVVEGRASAPAPATDDVRDPAGRLEAAIKAPATAARGACSAG